MKKTIAWMVGLTLASAAAWLFLRGPKMAPASTAAVERSAARLARGEFLFVKLMDCDGCHSERDLQKFGGPVIAGRRGVGKVFPKEMGLPGSVVARNLTPDRETGLGAWTDGEIIRAIREGISRDGRGLFPMMPYQNYSGVSDEDVNSLVVYLRSLPAVRNELPASTIDFPVNLLMAGAPQPVGHVAEPDLADKLTKGKYLVRLGGCQICHTKMDKGAPIEGMTLGGGEMFRVAGFEVHSANISPDMETGIGGWNEARFIEKFKSYANFNESNLPPAVQANFTVMGWLGLRELSEADLSAIYAFLKTAKPVRNKVDVHPAAVSTL